MTSTGTLDLYCVIGNPIEHSRSPAIHARFAELTGEKLVYQRQLFALSDFAGQLRALAASQSGQNGLYRLRGCNVTVPFKLDATQFATHLSDRVILAKACNTLSWDGQQWSGDNTDGLGLVQDIERNAGMDLAGRTILLLGAGGASAGVLAPLLARGPKRLLIANRTVAKAQALLPGHQRLAELHQVSLEAMALADLRGAFDLVINATASSLQGQALDLSGVKLAPGALVYDMMYGAKAEAFLNWAGQQGAVGRDGLGMLVEQAAESFYIWRGLRPPSSQVLRELQAGLL